MSNHLVIRNTFIESLLYKYSDDISSGWDEDNDNIQVHVVKRFDEGSKRYYDILRVVINCAIGELRDIFQNIKSTSVDKSEHGYIVRSYVNNNNPDAP